MLDIKFGARRSHPSKLASALPASEHPAIKAASLSVQASVDLDKFSPPRLNQGRTGSCTGHAIAGAIVTVFASRGHPLPFIPSQRAIYAPTRAHERAASVPAGVLPPLEDNGAQLADVIGVVASLGVKPMSPTVSPDGRSSDVWSEADAGPGASNVNDEPSVLDLEVSAETRIEGPYLVANANDTDGVVAALNAGLPVFVGFFCDSAFQALQVGDVAPAPNMSDSSGGGHAVFLSGYATVNGARVFILTNSWGANWCDKGRCLVSEAWVKAAWECWAISPRIAS